MAQRLSDPPRSSAALARFAAADVTSEAAARIEQIACGSHSSAAMPPDSGTPSVQSIKRHRRSCAIEPSSSPQDIAPARIETERAVPPR